MRSLFVVIALLSLLPAFASARRAQTDDVEIFDRWQRDVIIVVDFTGNAPTQQRVQEAVAAWDNAATAFTMIYDQRDYKPCDDVGWEHGQIRVCLEEGGPENGGVSVGLYKCADGDRCNDNHTINRGRIWFRGTPIGGMAVHEMGHTLGFGHENDLDSIMHTGSYNREPRLYPDDYAILLPLLDYV